MTNAGQRCPAVSLFIRVWGHKNVASFVANVWFPGYKNVFFCNIMLQIIQSVNHEKTAQPSRLAELCGFSG